MGRFRGLHRLGELVHRIEARFISDLATDIGPKIRLRDKPGTREFSDDLLDGHRLVGDGASRQTKHLRGRFRPIRPLVEENYIFHD